MAKTSLTDRASLEQMLYFWNVIMCTLCPEQNKCSKILMAYVWTFFSFKDGSKSFHILRFCHFYLCTLLIGDFNAHAGFPSIQVSDTIFLKAAHVHQSFFSHLSQDIILGLKIVQLALKD